MITFRKILISALAALFGIVGSLIVVSSPALAAPMYKYEYARKNIYECKSASSSHNGFGIRIELFAKKQTGVGDGYTYKLAAKGIFCPYGEHYHIWSSPEYLGKAYFLYNRADWGNFDSGTIFGPSSSGWKHHNASIPEGTKFQFRVCVGGSSVDYSSCSRWENTTA